MAGQNPYSLDNVLQNYRARMLPLQWQQSKVYPFGQKNPPGLEGYGPTWEVVTVSLAALQTAQLRINVQRDFHILALVASSVYVEDGTAAGGFRAQLYDYTRRQRLADRGVNWNNLTGPGGRPFVLTEPLRLPQPDSQLLVIIQNLDTTAKTNECQLVLYGVALRFNDVGHFPGGSVISAASTPQQAGGQ